MATDDLPAGIVPATAAMVDNLARRLRPEHIREVNAIVPLGGENALRLSFQAAKFCYAGIREGELLFLFGVGRTSPLTRAAMGWLLGAPEMDKHGMWIANASRQMLPFLHRVADADIIENWIPADYSASLRWLEWLDFEIGLPEPVINGVPHVHVWHIERMHP